jgi:hypothetical protein
MIKKILDWILGKSEPVKAAEAPYKVEAAPAFAPEVAVTPPAAQDTVVETKVTEEVAVVQPVVETTPVTVKAKYKRVDLNKMTKAELLALATKHGVEVKSRAPKADLVKALTKV